MAETPISASDLRPSYVAQPDMRFATSFISNDLRDYSVNGEVLMDKSSGELFTRRPADGRVVSFFQNKKYMDELMFELRVLLNNNASLVIPSEEVTTGYMTSTNYDLVCINNDKTMDALKSNTQIPNNQGSQSYHHLKFRLSKDANGFFTRITTRDCDKPVVNFLENEYNNRIRNYTGANAAYLAEKTKLNAGSGWDKSNATINYDLRIQLTDGRNADFSNQTANVEMNEESCVLLPTSALAAYDGKISYMEVTITSINYDKIHFMINHMNDFGASFKSEYDRFLYSDGRVLVNYLNVITFVDKSTDIVLNGNEFIVAMMDLPQCYRIMNKMAKLKDSASFYLSVKEPLSTVWGQNGVWAEHIREVYENSVVEEKPSKLRFEELEEFLASTNAVVEVNLTTDITDTDAYVLKNPEKFQYSSQEVDQLLSKMSDDIIGRAKAVVSMNDTDLTDNGIFLNPVE